MQPNSDSSSSPLATLRQLKELLDAGAITPAEFETLKRQLIFDGAAAGGGGAAPHAAPTPPTAAVVAPVTPAAVPVNPPPARPAEFLPAPTAAPAAEAAAVTSALETGGATAASEAAGVAGRGAGSSEPNLAAASYEPSAFGSAPVLAHAPLPPADPAPSLAADRRNPLTLVFAIGGGVLVLLLVLYLALGNRNPDEHLTSGSLTPADTAAAKPEEGPQAEQITLPPVAGPETVRVAPVTPPPAASAAATTFTDSTAVSTRPATPAPPAATEAPAAAVDSTAAPTTTP